MKISGSAHDVYMGHYQKMEQSLSLMIFSQARCPKFAFSFFNIIIRGALLEPHAISCFRVSHPVNKVYMGGENLRLSINCLYGYVLENFELSHR